MPDIHIFPSAGKWIAIDEHGDVLFTHDTQAEAEQLAEDYLRGVTGEVFTHRDEKELGTLRPPVNPDA